MQHLENTLYVMTQGAYAHLDHTRASTSNVRSGCRCRCITSPRSSVSATCWFPQNSCIVVPTRVRRWFCSASMAASRRVSKDRFRATFCCAAAQHARAASDVFCLDTARAMIAGKIRNSRQILLRGAREAAEAEHANALSEAAEQLANALRRVAHAADLDIVRGIEGEAAKNYFAGGVALAACRCTRSIRDGWSYAPPTARSHECAASLYAMLMNDCRSAVEAAGLDPQLGFLHAVRPGRAALALDLMEELRAWVADRLALTLINRGQIRPPISSNARAARYYWPRRAQGGGCCLSGTQAGKGHSSAA